MNDKDWAAKILEVGESWNLTKEEIMKLSKDIVALLPKPPSEWAFAEIPHGYVVVRPTKAGTPRNDTEDVEFVNQSDIKFHVQFGSMSVTRLS